MTPIGQKARCASIELFEQLEDLGGRVVRFTKMNQYLLGGGIHTGHQTDLNHLSLVILLADTYRVIPQPAVSFGMAKSSERKKAALRDELLKVAIFSRCSDV